MALVLALLAGCANPQRTRGTFEIIEIRLSGDVVVGFAWKDDAGSPCRRFAIFREGDRLSMAFDDGLIVDSRYTLVEVVPDRVLPVKVQACPDPASRWGWTCPGLREFRSLHAVGEVTYESGTRRRTTVRIPSPRPILVDPCRQHGGTRFEPDDPPPPPTLPAYADADWMLYWADQHWRSKNPRVRRRAQENYRLLLYHFLDSKPVRRNLDVIAERAAAELEE